MGTLPRARNYAWGLCVTLSFTLEYALHAVSREACSLQQYTPGWALDPQPFTFDM
jgi:hypothetical protein